MSLSSIDLGLRDILSDPIRRQEFFRTITQDDIAAQIRALRKARELTQTKFAALAGMKQSAVSRIEQAEYASWTLATLFRVAAALDARWRMILEPAEEAVKEFEDIDAPRPVALPDVVISGAGHTLLIETKNLPATGAEWLRFLIGIESNLATPAPSLQTSLAMAPASQEPNTIDNAISLLQQPIGAQATIERRHPISIGMQ